MIAKDSLWIDVRFMLGVLLEKRGSLFEGREGLRGGCDLIGKSLSEN